MPRSKRKHAYIPNAIPNAMVINPLLTIIYRIPSRPQPTSLDNSTLANYHQHYSNI